MNLPGSIAQRAAEVVSPGIPRGMDLLDTPLLNKGTAFSDTERTQFGLHGLLPPCVETLEEQVARAHEAYARKEDDLERHIYLRSSARTSYGNSVDARLRVNNNLYSCAHRARSCHCLVTESLKLLFGRRTPK